MNGFASFLSNNPHLREITLTQCNIGTATFDALANALMNRTADTLKSLDLRHNNLGDCNLDSLVTLFSKCTKLTSLWLCSNGIDQRVCVSLDQLLKSPESNLEYLHLSDNAINDEGVKILADLLSNNTKLRTLDLHGNNNISESGWLSLLKLICNTSSMTTVNKSNHTLYGEGDMKAAVVSALGVDKANLLFASLELNRNWRSWRDNTPSIIRQKMVWAHATRGDIKFVGSDIPIGVMPVILSWFGDNSNRRVPTSFNT